MWWPLMRHAYWCCAGLAVSCYALYVEWRRHSDPTYRALCDLGPRASCSNVLTSPYSRSFGLLSEDSALSIPNCILGIFYYILQLYLGSRQDVTSRRLAFYGSCASALVSGYLAYLLAFVLRDFCLVCVTTYGVNAGLLYITYGALTAATGTGGKARKGE